MVNPIQSIVKAAKETEAHWNLISDMKDIHELVGRLDPKRQKELSADAPKDVLNDLAKIAWEKFIQNVDNG